MINGMIKFLKRSWLHCFGWGSRGKAGCDPWIKVYSHDSPQLHPFCDLHEHHITCRWMCKKIDYRFQKSKFLHLGKKLKSKKPTSNAILRWWHNELEAACVYGPQHINWSPRSFRLESVNHDQWQLQSRRLISLGSSSRDWHRLIRCFHLRRGTVRYVHSPPQTDPLTPKPGGGWCAQLKALDQLAKPQLKRFLASRKPERSASRKNLTLHVGTASPHGGV